MSKSVTCIDDTRVVYIDLLEKFSPVIRTAIENNQQIVLPFSFNALYTLTSIIQIDFQHIIISDDSWQYNIEAANLADFLGIEKVITSFVKIVSNRFRLGHAIVHSDPKKSRTRQEMSFFHLPDKIIAQLNKTLLYRICEVLTSEDVILLLDRLDQYYKDIGEESNLKDELRELWDCEYVLSNMTDLTSNKFFSLECCANLLSLTFLNLKLCEVMKKYINEINDDGRLYFITLNMKNEFHYLIKKYGNPIYDHILNNDWLCCLYSGVKDLKEAKTIFLLDNVCPYTSTKLKELGGTDLLVRKVYNHRVPYTVTYE